MEVALEALEGVVTAVGDDGDAGEAGLGELGSEDTELPGVRNRLGESGIDDRYVSVKLIGDGLYGRLEMDSFGLLAPFAV